MKSAYGSRSSMTCIASPHIGPAKPEPDAVAMYWPPMTWPARPFGRPTLSAPAIIAAVASCGV